MTMAGTVMVGTIITIITDFTSRDAPAGGRAQH